MMMTSCNYDDGAGPGTVARAVSTAAAAADGGRRRRPGHGGKQQPPAGKKDGAVKPTATATANADATATPNNAAAGGSADSEGRLVTLPCAADGPLCALVFKVVHSPQGPIALVRV